MTRRSAGYVAWWFAVCAALSAASPSRADALTVVQLLREGGCGGILPAVGPLQPNASLRRAAALWATGDALRVALARSGYPGWGATAFHVSGQDDSIMMLMRRSGCRTIASRQLHDIGVFQYGRDAWVIVASPDSAVPSQPLAAASLEARALELVNDARAHGMRCGRRFFSPAPPLHLSSVLANVASGHALDMAEHGYFEHEDLRGESPADRVRAVGYRERLVGENIAYGTQSIDETVRGWLESPGHCENVMDRRFTEMGIAYAPGTTSRHGLYWVQVLAER